MEENNKTGIYMILNTVNLKVYIGSTVNFTNRRATHFNSLRKGFHHNSHLQASFNKYGEDKFTFIILERNVLRGELFIRENFHIQQKNSLDQSKGYNLAIPSKDDNMVMRPETLELKRRKAYIQHYGEVVDEDKYNEWRDKIINFTPETREEKRAKAVKRCGKPLYGICQTTNTILKEYNSVQEAMDDLHVGAQRVIDRDNVYISKMALVSVENYYPNKDYTKQYKTREYVKKGPKTGDSVETFNPDTLETIKVFSNQKELALELETTVKYIGKIRRGEKSKGIYKGVSIRYSI